MGLLVPHALGRSRLSVVKRETSFGSFVPPVASDTTAGEGRFRALKSKIGVKHERVNRADARATRSNTERITRKRTASWMVESYNVPSGAAGTAPDMGAFWLAAFGVQTITPATSVAYTLSGSQTAPGSLSITHMMDSLLMEAGVGCVVDEFKISISGGDEPKLSFSGPARDHVHTSYTTLSTSPANGATSFSVNQPDAIMIDSIIQVGTSTASGAGHRVTNKVGAVITITPGLTGAQTAGLDVVPFVPTDTTAGAASNMIDGAIQIADDGGGLLTIPVMGLELTLKNNVKMLTDHAFETLAADAIFGYREISGEVTLRARRTELHYLGTRRDFTAQDLRIIVGNAAGALLTINADCELGFSDVEIPEADEATFKLPFVGLASASEGELTATFT